VNALAGRGIATAGAVLAIVAIWIDATPGESYWDFDGTLAGFGLALGIIAALLVAAGYIGAAVDGPLFAVGAVLIGYWGWFPAATAFNHWDDTRAGMWLAFGGGVLIALGAAVSLAAAGRLSSTPAGTSTPALAAGLGIALVFPGIFLDASGGQSYWDGPLGHSLGIVMLILAIVAGLAWAVSSAGMSTHGFDAAVTLVLLGLVAFIPISDAFNNLGDLDSGAWLALAGGILAAGGTWAVRGGEMPRTAAAPARN
jgi:hypothetical protein